MFMQRATQALHTYSTYTKQKSVRNLAEEDVSAIRAIVPIANVDAHSSSSQVNRSSMYSNDNVAMRTNYISCCRGVVAFAVRCSGIDPPPARKLAIYVHWSPPRQAIAECKTTRQAWKTSGSLRLSRSKVARSRRGLKTASRPLWGCIDRHPRRRGSACGLYRPTPPLV